MEQILVARHATVKENLRPKLPLSQPKVDQALERAGRIQHVRLALAPHVGENLTAKRFGELVAEIEGRKPYDKATPTRWEQGAAPTVGAVEAMSRLARKHGLAYVSRAWLAFGPSGVAEAIEAPPAPLVKTADPPAKKPRSAKEMPLRGYRVARRDKRQRGTG